MANNLTRINNNQISTASSGNVYLGIDASTKVQGYTITGGLLANNLTYGSDLTVTGNLTVQGTTTAVNTVNTLISDPLIVLADGQTTGTPAVDIGYIGLRGSQDNIAVAWKEGDKEVVAAFTTTESGNVYSNTTFTITNYANFHSNDLTASGNLAVSGTTSLAGNVISPITVEGNITATPGNYFLGDGSQLTGVTASSVDAANLTGNTLSANVLYSSLTSVGTLSDLSVTGTATTGNLLTGGEVSATGNVTGGNVNGGNLYTGGEVSATGTVTGGDLATGGNVSATGNITGANFSTSGAGGNITGANNIIATTISGTANVIGGNILTGGYVSATGDVTGGNVYTGGEVSATGNVTAGAGSYFIGDGSQLTGVTAASVDASKLTGNTLSSNVLYSSLTSVGTLSDLSVTGTATAGNLATGGTVSATGTATAGNLATGGTVSASGNITAGAGSYFIGDGSQLTGVAAASVNANALVGSTLSSNVLYSSLTSVGTLTDLSVSGTTTSGNLYTGGAISATGTATAGNVLTGGEVSASGTVTGGDLATGGNVSATGNVTGGNVLTNGYVSAQGNVLGGNVITDYILSTDTATTTLTVNAATISLNPLGNVGLNSRWINNLADPAAPQDAATKYYVDSIAQGLDLKASCDLATVAELDSLAMVSNVVYNNGNVGVGATLTITTTTQLYIDGVSVGTIGTGANARILIKNEAANATATSDQAWNGIYTVTSTGALSTVLTRSTDFDDEGPTGQLPGAFTFIDLGNVNAATGWVCIVQNPVTMGTTPIPFAQFSGAGQYTAGNALTLNGTQFNVNVDSTGNSTIGINGSNELYIPSGVILTTPNIGAATGTSVSVTGTVTGGDIATAGTVSATGNVTGGNVLTGGYVSANGDVTGGNLYTVGETSATGNVSGGNVLTGGYVSATGNLTGANVLTGGYVSATGTVTGGDIATSGNVSATGTVTGSDLYTAGVVSASGNVTGGNVLTGGYVSSSGNITAGAGSYFIGDGSQLTGVAADSVNANALVGNTLSSNVLYSSLTSVGTLSDLSVTGSTTSGNLYTGGEVSATSNVTGGNLYTGGEVSATGNITAGSGSYFIGDGSQLTGVTASSVDAANLTGNTLSSNVLYSSLTSVGTLTDLSVTGTATVGNVSTVGYVSAQGNVTGGNVLTGGEVSASGTVTGGDLATGGNVSATGNVTGGNVLTGGYVSASGDVTGNNLYGSGELSVTGNITGGNISTSGSATLGNIVISGDDITDTNGRVNINTALGAVDFAVNGLTANVVYVNATTGTVSFGSDAQTTDSIVAFNSSNSVLMPVGNTAQRPAGVTGQLRFNTTINSLEVYTNSGWQTVGQPDFTVITDQQFTGTGSQTVYTLSANATTAGTIVSINGVQQIPTTAYSVSNTTLTFTEAPEVGDLIDVRTLVTTTTVTSISNDDATAAVAVTTGSPYVQVTGGLVVDAGTGYIFGDGTYLTNVGGGNVTANKILSGNSQVNIATPGGDVYIAVAGANVFDIGSEQSTFTGNLNPAGNTAYSLGNATNQWKSLYVGNNTIYIGGTPIGTYNDQLTVNGNAVVTVGQTTAGNMTVAGTITGTTISATGNISGSYLNGNGAFITGLPAGYTNANTAAFLAAFGSNTISTTGTITAGNITGGNLLTSGAINTTGTVTATSTVGGVITGSSTSVSGGVTAASVSGGVITGTSTSVSGGVTAASVSGGVITGTSASASGNVTGGNVLTGGYVSSSGNILTGEQIQSTAFAGGNISWSAANQTDFQGQIKIGGTGRLLSPGGAASITLNNNGANIPVVGVTSATATTNTTSGALIVTGGAGVGGNIYAGGLVSATGDINTSGNVSATGNATVGGFVSATGQVRGANIVTAGFISATSTITTAGQLGANSVSATGDVQIGGNLSVTGNVNFSGNITQITGNSAQFFGNTTTGYGALYAGITSGYANLPSTVLQVASNANTYSQLEMQNINSGSQASSDYILTADNGSDSAYYGDFGIASSTYAYPGQTAIAPTDVYLYGVGTSESGPYSGTGGNLILGSTNAQIKFVSGGLATSNVVATMSNTGLVVTGLISATGTVTASTLTSTVATGTAPFTISSTTKVAGLNVEQVDGFDAAQAGTVSTIVVRDSSGYANVAGLINSGANGVGNIGSSTTYFNTVFAKATSAQYADLAEKYVADAEYAPGTVLVFGGTAEVTVNAVDSDRRVAGVVSTNPSYIMNGGLEGANIATVALTGRVPTLVVGPVKKGDMMVAAGLGRARAEADPKVGTVIGKALEDFDGAEGTIEVVVGRF